MDSADLRPLQRPWWLFGGLVAVVAFVGLVARTPSPSTLPAILPVGLTLAAGAGALAGMAVMQRALWLSRPQSDAAALRFFQSRQVAQIAIALAPVLVGTALGVVFGQRASVLAAALVGSACLAFGLPRPTRVRALDASWQERADASIFRALRAE